MFAGALGRVRVVGLMVALTIGAWWLVSSNGSTPQALESGTVEQSDSGVVPAQPGQPDDPGAQGASPMRDIELPVVGAGGNPPDAVGLRSEVRHNGAGREVTLDEAASLACADLEVALAFADDDPTRSAAALESAIERASDSTVPRFGRVAGLLRSVAVGNQERALTRDNVVEAFEICVAGGYEL